MKQFFLFLIILTTTNYFSQNLKIITANKTEINVLLVDSLTKSNLITTFIGRKDSTKFKEWTSKTYVLNDKRIIIDFFDKQGVVIDNEDDFHKLNEVRFVKNQVWNLKKNISYKIVLNYSQGIAIVEKENPKKLTEFKSDLPEYYDFDIYQLENNQILFIDKSENSKSATLFPDIKTLASENLTVAEQFYGSEDEENLMQKLASGNVLTDFEPNEHLIYSKYIEELIKNHKLNLIKQKVYIREFYGNLFKSENNGFYFLIDDENQKNGTGAKMPILTINIFENINEVQKAEKDYREYKNRGHSSEHFYQKISDQYGENFPILTSQLIENLPQILNIEKENLTFNTNGIEIIDEAILWNRENYILFEKWFPSVLAFYGQCYIEKRKDGLWTTIFDKENKVWIPQLQLTNGTFAWDWIDIYKGLLEGSINLKWYGEWK